MVCEMSNNKNVSFLEVMVLILVLVEDGLRVFISSNEGSKNRCVLILVLVEDGLREKLLLGLNRNAKRLNPCFNGRWSARSYQPIRSLI